MRTLEHEGEKILHKELSYRIIEACIEVHNNLGPGFSEKIYERALCKELNRCGIAFERQKVIPVYYKDDLIGEHRLDLLIDGRVVLELKAVSELIPLFSAQVFSYLKSTALRLGILVNFGEKRLRFVRIVH